MNAAMEQAAASVANATATYARLTGDDLREFRQALGLSQSELARRLGYSRSAICRWERGGACAPIPLGQVQSILETLLAARQQQVAWLQQVSELTLLLLGGGNGGT